MLPRNSFQFGLNCFIIGFFCFFSFLNATPIPGRWEKVEGINIGERVTVITDSESIQNCRYEFLTDEYLGCVNENGDLINIAKDSIAKVTLFKRDKYIKRGFVYGFIVGAVSGVVYAARNEGSDDLSPAFFVVGPGAIGGLVGCLVGTGLGNPETIYISKNAALEESK